MPESTGLVSSQPARLNMLRSKHAYLDRKIEEVRKFPSTSDILLRRLKAEKLMLKDEILAKEERRAS